MLVQLVHRLCTRRKFRIQQRLMRKNKDVFGMSTILACEGSCDAVAVDISL